MHSNGLATILLMIPILAVPALAIFGVPQFAPVVASPLDEGLEFDRILNGGKLPRPARDEISRETDGIGTEQLAKDDSRPDHRDSFGGHRAGSRSGAQRSTAAAWADDTSSESEWPSSTRRKSLFRSSTEVADADPGAENKVPRRSQNYERLSRKNPRPTRAKSEGSEIQLAAASDTDAVVTPADWKDDPDSNEQPSAARDDLVGSAADQVAKDSKQRSTTSETLTLQSAIERLNELEIRSFRLERGRQPNQFVFVCSYTPPETPRVSYRFEAVADEPLKAVSKVIEQIVEWRQRR